MGIRNLERKEREVNMFESGIGFQNLTKDSDLCDKSLENNGVT